MASRKRLHSESDVNEYEKLESIASPKKSAKIHAVVDNVSPMKVSHNGYNYFNATLSDDTKTLELVGYDESKRQELSAYGQTPVVLDKCEIKESWITSKMDIRVTSLTTITPSSKRIKPIVYSLGQLPYLQENTTLITVCAEVIEIGDTHKVATGNFVQNVTLSDPSGTGILVLWDDNRGKLEKGKFYKLNRLRVTSFNSQKQLTHQRSSKLVFRELLNNATVKTVKFSRHACITCGGEVVAKSEKTGQCTKCFVFQHLKEPTSIDLLLSCNNQDHNFKIFPPEIKSIADIDDDATEAEIAEGLLAASPFSFTFNKDNNRIIEVIRLNNKLLS